MRYGPMPTALAAAAMLVVTPAAGQQTPAPAPADATPATAAASAACCTIPAMMLVDIEIAETLGSKASHQGDHFAFRLAEPIVVDGQVLAPAGTPGVGEVVHAARARAMGKAGELILAARYLDLGAVRIPLRTFRYGRSQGKDSSQSVGIGTAVAGAFIPGAAFAAFLIAGGEVRIPAGTRATAKVAAATAVAPASSPQQGGVVK